MAAGSARSLLKDSEISSFRDSGYLLLKGFYDAEADIVPIQASIHRIIGQVMQRHGHPDARRPFTPQTFDDGYADLIARQRSWGGEVYDAVKQIPALMRLVASGRNEQLFSELREASVPGIAAGGYGIRIDNPGEERFRAPWHQEYPAQLRSLDGVVFWTPLIPVTCELGPVSLCPGSHRDGLVPVYTRDPENPDKVGAYGLRLKDEDWLVPRYGQVAPLPDLGDLLVLDFLTLHASGLNTGTRSRWSIQFRYFNFADPTGRAHGWKGSYAAGVDFRVIHPELCAD